MKYADVAKTFAGAVCPECGKPHIRIEKGIEIGNIFQLGKKYTESMGMTIAPWQVEICNLRVDDPQVKETADRLYAELLSYGVEVLYDDRDIRPGAMFAASSQAQPVSASLTAISSVRRSARIIISSSLTTTSTMISRH